MSSMVFRLDVEPLDEHRATIEALVPFVDGRSLVDLVEDFEVGQGCEPSGGYGGLAPVTPRATSRSCPAHHLGWFVQPVPSQ